MEYWNWTTWALNLFILLLVIISGRFAIPEIIQLWKAKNFRWVLAYTPFVLSQIIIVIAILFDIIRHVTDSV